LLHVLLAAVHAEPTVVIARVLASLLVVVVNVTTYLAVAVDVLLVEVIQEYSHLCSKIVVNLFIFFMLMIAAAHAGCIKANYNSFRRYVVSKVLCRFVM
jgi:hypothetical protein